MRSSIYWLTAGFRPKTLRVPVRSNPEISPSCFGPARVTASSSGALEDRSIPTYVYKGLGFFDADEIKDIRALIRFLGDPTSDLRAAALLRSRFAGVSDLAIVALAGRLSDTLVSDAEPSGAQPLPADDLRRLVRLHAGLSTWLRLVDRCPPAEVIDRVLHEAAYAFELRGRHVIQARENVKKMRGLVRRLQNRGYATMARISDQLDHLADDISTALVEAYDAVNFMTVHAAKGLEFPIVFLVDLGRGTGSQAPAVRVIPDRGDGEPSVTVWPFRSAADGDERQRDLGETKRLLYVATTRARDRLYFSTALKGGQVNFNRGSFGEVLPPGMGSAFERALEPGTTSVEWRSAAGRSHQFRFLAPVDGVAGDKADREPTEPDPELRAIDLAPVTFGPAVERATVTAVAAGPSMREEPVASETSSRILGLIVHQLLERFSRDGCDRRRSRRGGQTDASTRVIARPWGRKWGNRAPCSSRRRDLYANPLEPECGGASRARVPV